MTERGRDAALGEPVPLAGGRVLSVRAVRPGDAEGLEELYERLAETDRYRRFFSSYRPPRAFYEAIETVSDRGGFGLVAVVDEPDGQQIVGEASYTLLPDGNGELGIVVDGRWRGWLGPYLLDALLTAAGGRGVPNIEADVLVSNGSMLALARSRDCVVMDRPDVTVVRVLMGTAPPAPSWSGDHHRQRVLVEGPGTTWHRDAAATAGLEVVTCPGPSVRRTPCPALAGEVCPLAAGADVIVVRFSDEEALRCDLVAAHHRLHHDVPVLVDAPPGRDSGAALTATQLPQGDGDAVVAFVAARARPLS